MENRKQCYFCKANVDVVPSLIRTSTNLGERWICPECEHGNPLESSTRHPEHVNTFTKQQVSAKEWFELGQRATDQDEKMRCFSKSIRLKPNPASYVSRGDAHDSKGEFDEAIRDYNDAIKLRPDYAVAYNNRGTVRKKIGDISGAMSDYNEAIRLQPEDPEPYLNRGNVYVDEGRFNLAVDDYQRYLKHGGGKLHGDQEEIQSLIRRLQKHLANSKTGGENNIRLSIPQIKPKKFHTGANYWKNFVPPYNSTT